MQIGADELPDNPLPETLRIIRVEFKIHKGVLYHYTQLTLDGLGAIPEKEARRYFMETDTLLHPKQGRVYTPEKLRRGVSNLEDILERQGYQEAKAEVAQLNRDDKHGAMRALIHVQQGPRFIVHSVREKFFFQDASAPDQVRTVFPKQAYSKLWEQDFTQSLKTNEFRHGYPDAAVEITEVARKQDQQRIELDLEAAIQRGPQIRIGAVEFHGQKKTKASLMARRVRVQRGELLDRIKVEEGRYRLAQLGSFETVDLNYKPAADNSRDVEYGVKEGKTLDLSLLFGYGSYELLRAGFEVEQFNLWGLGHHDRLKAVQSFKASSADFTYTVPELVGKDVDLFANASGLRREEVSFTRLEYGGGLGAHKYYKDLATDLSVRYNYQILNAAEVAGIVATEGATNTTVGAIIADVKHDRRDNPLYPRRGYKIFANVELASDYLGGEVSYERFEISTSWHHPLGGGRYVAVGLSHGAVFTVGDPAKDLPFNRRFFPGGQNSIRGYGEGEASPRDAQGKLVGAETYALGTVEFEQALTPKWSLVLFSDSLGFAERARNYPFDTGLYSVGGGLRWKTIIGPVRVEYGHNLNPRSRDPSGTLQFSLGFPF
jgi:outer membrane protein assembly complex protein YaeT